MIVECWVTYNIKCELEVIKRIRETNDEVTGRWIVMVTNKTTKPFWLVGYLLFMLMVGTNLPTPLYGIYKHQWGFSAGVLTLVFAVYALTIIPSLLLFGQLSDRFGRKKALLPGLIVAAIGSILFALAHDVTWLFIARAIQGLAVGIVSGAGTAALAELHPHGDRRQAALIASVATAGGTALGPLLAGILAQYEPWPAVFPFVVHLILFVPGVLALLFIPETVHAKLFHCYPLHFF